ncbi:MAG: ferrochelatase [Bacteroidota bacterium]
MASTAKKAILLVNLGSPDSTSVPDVRKYLAEFLMDGRVLDSNPIVRTMVVYLAILPKRPKESAHAYETIWWPEGSPLKVISARVQKLLKEKTELPVGLAMRYQNPSIEAGITELLKENPQLEEIILVPLYPQYAMSTTETVMEKAQEVLKKLKSNVKLNVIPPFYNNAEYIAAMVESAKDFLKEYDHVLFSYHGIPERHVLKTDPTGNHCLQSVECCNIPSPAHEYCYRHQCFEVTKSFVKAAGIPEGKYTNSFQSRLGRTPWLKPYTDFVLKELPQKGVKKLLVLCPAFVSDCLETLEEIAIRGKEDFLEAGGEEFTFIPCMNEHPAWIEALKNLCEAQAEEKSFTTFRLPNDSLKV